MTALKKVQGINSLGLIYPLAGSETNNSSETPNLHQNIDMIALIFLKGINPGSLSTPLDNSKPKNSSETTNCHQNFETIDLHPSNQLMMKSSITKPEPSIGPSTNLWGKKIQISDLDTAHRQFEITTKDKFQDQWMLIQ